MLRIIITTLVFLCWLASSAMADSSKGGLGTRTDKNIVVAPPAATRTLNSPSPALTVHEGSFDYFIAQAARLAEGDDRQQLQQLQQQLQVLRAQAQALRAQIAGKEAAAAATEMEDQRRHLQSEIAALQERLRQVENQIAQTEAKAREIANRHEQNQQEGAGQPTVPPRPITVQPLRKPLSLDPK